MPTPANNNGNPTSVYLPDDVNRASLANTPRATSENANYSAYGKDIINHALMGLAASGSAAALYHLINGFGSAKIPALVRDPAVAETDKKPEKAKKNTRPAFKFAADNNWYENLTALVGRLPPKTFFPDINLPSAQPAAPGIGPGHEAWRTAFNLAAGVGGGAAGIGIANSIASKKRKEDLLDQVEDARKEYFDALTGKSAELDTAYENIKTAGASPWDYFPTNWSFAGGQNDPKNLENIPRTVGSAMAQSGKTLNDSLATAILLTTLGTGAIGAKYMYDQTKSRTVAENLRRAQASRARLRGIQQTPWIDPEELASMAGR